MFKKKPRIIFPPITTRSVGENTNKSFECWKKQFNVSSRYTRFENSIDISSINQLVKNLS